MLDKKTPTEEYDDGSSLEKNFEYLDKNSPEYASRRESLIEKMRLQKKDLETLDKKIKAQRTELKNLMAELQNQAATLPQDENIKQLIAETRQDQEFLTRALAEVSSCKGRWNIDRAKLQASKDFNTPLDLKIITDVNLKPLPSSEITRKKEAERQIGKDNTTAAKRSRGNLSAKLQNGIGKQIMGLRLQSVAQSSTSQYSRQRESKQNERTQ